MYGRLQEITLEVKSKIKVELFEFYSYTVSALVTVWKNVTRLEVTLFFN